MTKLPWVMILAICLPAAAVVIGWDRSPEATGYRLYYGVASHIYESNADAGPFTSNAVVNLEPGRRYFFSVTAYNAAGESGFSDEITYLVPAERGVLTVDHAAKLSGPWTNYVTITNLLDGVAGFWRVNLTRTN